MPSNEEKKVELQFTFEDLVCKNIPLDGSCNPIAKRTRSQTKCPSASKSKNCPSTPTTKKSTRNINTPVSNSIPSADKTPSPKKAQASIKRSSSKKIAESSPYVRKASRPGCSSIEGKVTPLKILNTRSFSRNRTPSDDSSPEENTPLINLRRSLFPKAESPDDVFRPSPRKKKTPLKEKESASLISCATPKTPRPINGDSAATPRTRSTTRNRTIKNPSVTPSTPSSRRVLQFGNDNKIPPTPYSTRSKLKREIQTLTKIEENDSEDDYENSDSGDSECSVPESESDNSEEETKSDSDYKSTPAKKNRLSNLRKTEISSPSTLYRITPQKKITHQNVILLDSEKYFEKNSQKNVTSDNVLSKLPLPELTLSDISEIASKNYVKHRNEINCLTTKYKEQFNKWFLYLKEGFNLILYGLGSKLEILKEFHNDKLSNSCVLRVNGFNSNFSINEMVKVLAKDILQILPCPANINDALNLAAKEMERLEFHVFIIINNIDGVALRGSKKQTILSKLAESRYVHIIASLDHINAPLLWGNNKMSCFNFVWLDVTTFNSYATEISYQKSVDIENLGSDSSLILLNKVYNWQDRRTKEVFELIVKDFLNNKHKKNFKGTLTSELLRLAARNLSISSKSALISTLKAFIEHDIIYIEHNYLKFLIHPNILRSFYNQHFSQ